MADLTITAANVKVNSTSAVVEVVTAGATITAGDALYVDTTDQKWKLADCTTSATTAGATRIALTGGADTEPIVVIKPGQDVVIGATLTVGEVYVLSEAGAIAPVADVTTSDYLTIIGYGKTTTVMTFEPFATGIVAA